MEFSPNRTKYTRSSSVSRQTERMGKDSSRPGFAVPQALRALSVAEIHFYHCLCDFWNLRRHCFRSWSAIVNFLQGRPSYLSHCMFSLCRLALWVCNYATKLRNGTPASTLSPVSEGKKKMKKSHWTTKALILVTSSITFFLQMRKPHPMNTKRWWLTLFLVENFWLQLL